MTSAPLQLCWALAAIAGVGAFAVRALGLRLRREPLAFVALSWPAGALALGLGLFLYLRLGIEPRFWWTAPCFLALAFAIWGETGSRGRSGLRDGENGMAGNGGSGIDSGVAARRGVPWFAVFVAIGAAWVLLAIAAGASRPCVEGDEGNIWSLQAKSLLVDWYGGDYAAAQVHNLHPDYPLLNPLLQTWVHAQLGGIVHFENRLPVQLCALSLWLLLCSSLRRLVPGWLAASLAAIVLVADPFAAMCRTAYADGMVALGVLIAGDAWLRVRAGDRRFVGVGAIGAAFALWSKNESALYAVAAGAGAAVALAVAVRSGRGLPRVRWRSVAWLALPAVVVAIQVGWNAIHGLQNDLLGANETGRSLFGLLLEHGAERAPIVLGEAAGALLSPALPHGVLLVVLLAPFVWPRTALRGALLPVTVALVAAIVGLHLVWLGTHLELRHHLLTSYRRVLFQLVPVALPWCAALAARALAGKDPRDPSPA